MLFFAALFQSSSPFARGTSCSIPFQSGPGVPIITLTIDGKGPFHFIIDTGTSSEAIVTPELATRLDLQLVSQVSITDMTGQVRRLADEVEIPALVISGHPFLSVRALVHDPIATRPPYDGILGFRLFRNLLLTLDFPHRCMGLDANEALNAQDPDVLPLDISRRLPLVALNIGDQQAMALIDSGGTGLRIPSDLAARSGFVPGTESTLKAHTQTRSYSLIGGRWKGQIHLGEHNFQNPYIEVAAALHTVILGSEALEDFAVTFDQQRGLVRLHARTNHHALTALVRENSAPPQLGE